MMKVKSITMLGLGILLVSCVMSNQKFDESTDISSALRNPHMQSINIDSLNNETLINMTSVFKRVKTIILETNKNALISGVNSIQVYGDKIFILDKFKSKGIYVFNKTGKFIQRIGQVGQGPGEYVDPFDFTIDKKNKFIYVLDSRTQKILKYNFQTGKYIDDIKFADRRIMSFHIQWVGDKLYVDAFNSIKGVESYLIQELDFSTGERGKKWLKNVDYNKNSSDIAFLGHDVFYDKTQDSPKFIQSFMDTVVSVDKSGVIPYIAMKSKDLLKQKELDEMGGDISKKISDLMRMSKIYNINTYVTYKNSVYFECSMKNFMLCFLYNKDSKSTRFAHGLIDDLVYEKNNQHIGLYPQFYTSSNDGMYSV